MKENWTYKKLGEICDVINGLWTGKKEPFVNVAVIRNTNFSKDCKLKLDDVAYIDVEAKQFASRKLQCGDIIIEKSGGSEKQPVGRPVLFDIAEGDYSFSNFTSTLRIKEGERINPKFLHICLYSYYLQGVTLKMQSKTTGLHNLDMKAFLRLQIPQLPLETQSRIVSELDLLQSIIDKQKAQLKELDNLAQAVFYDMFGDPVENDRKWIVKKLGSLAVRIANGSGMKIKEDTYKTEGIVFFRCQNVWRNRIDYSDIVYIDDETHRLMKNSSLKHNDFLITKIGRVNTENSSLGRVSLYEGEDDKANLSGNLCYIRLREPVCHKFILYILISNQFRDYIRKTTVGAIDKRAINSKQIESFPIIMPPLSLQQSFADKIESIEKQKAAINQSIAETQRLFDFTMDKYFG